MNPDICGSSPAAFLVGLLAGALLAGDFFYVRTGDAIERLKNAFKTRIQETAGALNQLESVALQEREARLQAERTARELFRASTIALTWSRMPNATVGDDGRIREEDLDWIERTLMRVKQEGAL